MKSLIKISVLLVVIVTLASCKKDTAPNYQFMPNMYAPISYETFGESKAFANGIEAQLSAEGTISRGHSLFEYENSISQVNRHINPELETVFLITSPHLAPISSTIIRDLHRYGSKIDDYLPYDLNGI